MQAEKLMDLVGEMPQDSIELEYTVWVDVGDDQYRPVYAAWFDRTQRKLILEAADE